MATSPVFPGHVSRRFDEGAHPPFFAEPPMIATPLLLNKPFRDFLTVVSISFSRFNQPPGRAFECDPFLSAGPRHHLSEGI